MTQQATRASAVSRQPWRERDSFPLSTYPVYASTRPSTAEFATAVGTARRRIGPQAVRVHHRGTDDPLIAASRVADAVSPGRSADLCRQIIGRAPSAVTAVLVVTERHDLVRAARGDPSRLGRTVHARCDRVLTGAFAVVYLLVGLPVLLSMSGDRTGFEPVGVLAARGASPPRCSWCSRIRSPGRVRTPVPARAPRLRRPRSPERSLRG